MNWLQIATRRHVLTWIVNLLIVLAGWVGYKRIGVDRYPYFDFPMISVTTSMPGANPEVIDASITQVIESAAGSVAGIEHIQSDSFPGVSVVRMLFALTKDIDVAFNEVQAKVNQVLSELPEGADTPVVSKVEFGAVPILWVTLHGDRTLQQLNQYARTVIKKRLENIEGVGEVRFGGRCERAIRINLDLERMNAYAITAQDLIRAFQSEHFQLPGGFLVGQEREWLIKLDMEFHRPEEIGELIVAYRSGAPIRVQDLAEVEDGLEDARRMGRYARCQELEVPGFDHRPGKQDDRACQGSPAVALGIVKVTGANAVATIEKVKARLEQEILPALPAGMRLEIAIDDAALVLELVGTLKEHLVLGTLLTAAVVWLFLKNLRATLIIALAIPVSLLGAVAVMYLAGFTFNTMTLLGLLLLIGTVVDDAIVVLENVYRHREEGFATDALAAAEVGTRQVVFAVIATSLTLVSIFAPVIFMGGVIGSFFRSFAVVIACGVLVSLFVSLTLTPMLCARHLQIARCHGRLYRWLEEGFRALEEGYRHLLVWALAHRWWIVGIAVGVVWPSGFFLDRLGKGFLPNEDEGRFLISFKVPLGANLKYTDGRLQVVEKELARFREIASWLIILGGETDQVNRGDIFVRLEPRRKRDLNMSQVIDRLRGVLAEIPGIQTFPASIPLLGGQRGKPVHFVLQGPEVAALIKQVAADFLPRGYQVRMVGRAEEFEKTVGYILFALVSAIILVYMVLASQFNAFLQPLVIMLA